MKRSDMVLNIATEIVLQDCKINWDIAQTMAEAILKRIENDGMVPPFNKVGEIPFNTYDAILEAVSEDFKWEEE